MQKRRIFCLLSCILLILILLPFSFAAQGESHSYIRANGKIIADNYNDGTITQMYYYHYDALGNLVSTTDSQGRVVESQRIEAFGNELSKTKTVNVSERSFIGKEKDSNSLFYFGARYYDASTGRFISTDPLSGKQTSPETQNKYSYAVNNPLKYVDLNGKEVEEQGEDYQILGAQTATEFYAELANQPEVWKQTIGWTGGFFSSLGMHPLKTAATLAGGYAVGSLAAVPAALGTTAATGTGIALTATDVAVGTGGTALAGETIRAASQAVPKIVQSAQVVAQTRTAVAEAAPIITETLPVVQKTINTAVNTVGNIAPKGYNQMQGALNIKNFIETGIKNTGRALTPYEIEAGKSYIDQIAKNHMITEWLNSPNPKVQKYAQDIVLGLID